ncbi:MAG: hypothetical protein HKP18_08320 [Acidimicrobiia bacterium]|nr:hypothetical protein [Acidimicrobiia bacterium]NNJ47821.1 hypothetical protein [Acidimicrobiia bacterium]
MRAITVAIVVLAVITSACSGSSTVPAETTALTTPFTGSPGATERLLTELDLEGLSRPVSRLRELEFLEPVPVQILEDAAFRVRVNELTAAPPGITPDLQSSWLRLLGLLPAGTNTYAATSRLLQTSVAFYDYEEGRILVRAGAGVDPYVESVVVHELVHALQHQHFGRADPMLLDGDLGYVYTALVEGDAERVARRFIGELRQADEFAFEEGRLTATEEAIAILDSTPFYLLGSLAQPAADGVRFLQGVDYETVNGFFADLDGLSSLPQSSEEILMPKADLVRPDINLSPVLVLPYERLPVESTLGAGRLRLLLGQVEDTVTAERAVTGWANDRLDIRVSGEAVIFAYLFAGDTGNDAVELADSFGRLLESNLARDAYGSVRISNNQVLILAASDGSVRDRLDEIYSDFGAEVFVATP